MKRCSRCKQEKPVTEFQKDRSRKDGLQPRCRECQNAVTLAHSRRPEVRERMYARNREYYPEWYAERRARMVSLKLTLSCVDCGWQPKTAEEVTRLEFDHIDPATKHTLKKRDAFRLNWRWERIEAELAKCEPRCKECHMKRTVEQRKVRIPR